MGVGVGAVVDVEAPSGSWKARVVAIRRGFVAIRRGSAPGTCTSRR